MRILLALAYAFAVAFVACSDDGGDGEMAISTIAGGEDITLTQWADELCALAVEAAETLDVPGPQDTESLTLEDRKQRAAEVLAPRAKELADISILIAEMERPESAAGFHEAVETTSADVAAAWSDLVAAAADAQTDEELDAANEVWIQAQNGADASVLASYNELDDEAKAGLSEPADCGILNEIRA